MLDFWGDNVVHCAVFAAMAMGWAARVGSSGLCVGAAARSATLASATYVYGRTMTGPKEGPQFTSVRPERHRRISRAADALSRRDFIYLVVVLSAFGKAHWFLVIAAVGAPVFFFVLVALDRARNGGGDSKERFMTDRTSFYPELAKKIAPRRREARPCFFRAWAPCRRP